MMSVYQPHPLTPSPYQGEGDIFLKRGFAPLIRPKILGKFRGGTSPLFLLTPLPLNKGKGIKGIGLPNYYKERGEIFVFEGLRPFNLPR
jgi:hypothetical protein